MTDASNDPSACDTACDTAWDPTCAGAPVERLNQDCQCVTLDPAALARALDTEFGQAGLSARVRERAPWLFAPQPVFIPEAAVRRIAQVVQAIESVVALPAYRQAVLAAAPEAARIDPRGALGVFFGYDFHLRGDEVHLIEVNTNAGGALLNAALARAQRSCCADTDSLVPAASEVARFEQALVAMFRREWALAGAGRPLQAVAIVDTAPEDQFLHPEFLLFQQLFERHGMRAVIADPRQLQWRGGRLHAGDLPIDLVYNRLTDFYLEAPEHAALREAWRQQAVVLTPHPQAHALYADKALLAVFSDDAQLRAWGASLQAREVLRQCVPATERVTPQAADRLWARRRELFFKPVAGYGSRAAYRGDKLTRGTWQDILAGDYVAQALVRPGERQLSAGEAPPMKYDLRAYAYGGQVQWLAARLYQGQTTNMRTPGGGFAPVFSPVDAAGRPRGPGPHAGAAALASPD